jgi:uncharacterized protein YciI
MYIILLKFTDSKARAADFMAGHNKWLQDGFERGLILMAGSLNQGGGGVVFANGAEREVVEAFVREDPFVIEKIVTAEILQVSPSRLDPRLDFLKPDAESPDNE